MYALFEIPEVGSVMKARAHISPSEWFLSLLGITPAEYRVILVTLVATTMSFNMERPDLKHLQFNVPEFLQNMTPQAREAFIRLNQLAVIDIAEVRRERPPAKWSEATFGGNYLQRRQLFPLGESTYLVLDRNHYLNRYFHGLLYVLHDAAKLPGSPLSFSAVRSHAGYLFEGYVHWWLKQLFGPSAEYFFGEAVTSGTETDAVVVLDGIAFVIEANHHWLNVNEAFEASPKQFAAIVVSDLKKAIRAARTIATNGLSRSGSRLSIEHIVPIAILPEPLPITDLTAVRFYKELKSLVPDVDGDGGKIHPCQILTQDHLEFFDRAWRLPENASELSVFVRKRASIQELRFGPLALDLRLIKEVHEGNTWGELSKKAREAFEHIGPSFFKQSPPTKSV